MIIKKPYAFLIKRFRMIHFILSIFLIYIAYKSSALYNFFNAYVKQGYYTYYRDLNTRFINYYTFVIVITIVLVGLIVYFLLKWKDKKRLFYVFLCIFYLALFVVYIYLFDFIQTMQMGNIDIRLVRNVRDIALISSLPQYIFVIFVLLRGIGFDIKKFNFSKDIADLDINLKDNEEVELVLAQDTYKYMRTFRRISREIKYFALENKFFFIVILLVVGLSFGLSIYLNVEVYNKIYEEKETFIADNFNVFVDSSYVSTLDYKGQIISEKKAYVIVKLNIENNEMEPRKINKENYRLLINKKNYFPVLTKNNYFIDIGKGYADELIEAEKPYEILFIYEIELNDVNQRTVFRIVNNVSAIKGEISTNYKDTLLKPKKSQENFVLSEHNLKEKVELNKSLLNKSNIIINSFEIASSFSEKYTYCANKNCYEALKVIKPSTSSSNQNVMLKLDTNLELDPNIYIKRHITTNREFLNSFAYLSYKVNNIEKIIKLEAVSTPQLKSNLTFIEIPQEVQSAKDIKIKLIIRDVSYLIKL